MYRNQATNKAAAAAMDVLGAVLFACCIATPVAMWFFNLI